MKIIPIFADQLFSFHFEGERYNELDKILEQWNDVSYLYQFVSQNKKDIPKNSSVSVIVNEIIENAIEIDTLLNTISEDSSRRLEEFFKPLHNQEYHVVRLSKQKGRRNYLRVFAIKVDENCFVITGGAIKFHHLNKERFHTQKEMDKLDRCRDYLKGNNVFDVDSFYELLIDG